MTPAPALLRFERRLTLEGAAAWCRSGRPRARERAPSWGRSGLILGLAVGCFLFPLPWTGPSPLGAQAPDTLRILAYNTHHGEGLDGMLDLERIAEVIRSADPDVVALQEIDRQVERTGGVDQAQVYGEFTGLNPIFGDFMPYQGGHYGMALLSRHPVLEWENVRLPPGAEPRSTLAARIQIPGSGQEIWVGGIHFYRTREERLAQARTTLDFFRGVREPVFLVGDFNSQPGGAVLTALEEAWNRPEKEGAPFTFPADEPEREIDFILIRPQERVRVLEYRVLDEPVASDHRPVLMVVEILPPPENAP